MANVPGDLNKNDIVHITADQLTPCYTLLQNIFLADELNSFAQMQADLATPTSARPAEQFIMLARLGKSQGRSAENDLAISLIAGCYLSLEGHKFYDKAIGFIEYLATNPDFRNQHHASDMLCAFEQEMHSVAASRGERLCMVMGEVEPEFVEFKVKRGYQHPKSSKYAQPPISWDEALGIPLTHALPKLLMIKTWNKPIEAKLLEEAVRTIFERRYVPKKLDGNVAKKISEFIHKQIFVPFCDSLQVENGFVVMEGKFSN